MKQVKSLISEFVIVRENKDDYSLFTTDEVWEIDIPTDNYHHCGFVQVGDIITFQNKKYKVNKISFRINPKPSDINEAIDIYSVEPQYVRNCSILVFVDEY